jgi:large subunit ribosomal protein L15
MALNRFKPSDGSTRKKRRVGRGIGSGMGKTATRGTKGQKARRQVHPLFEGGQQPIQRRLPVKKGFRNVNHKEYAIVNLDDLQKHFEAGAEVTPEAMIKAGKILGYGTLDKKLKVQAARFSKSAAEAITAKGGEAITL